MSELTDIIFPKKDIKLEMNSGIGDSLKQLLITYRLFDYCIKNKIKCYVTYGKTRSCGWKSLLKDLISRNETFIFIEPQEFDNIDATNIEKIRIDPKKYNIVPVNFTIRHDEEFSLREKKNIAIQIRGNDTHKYWDIEKIKDLVNRIDRTVCDIHIYDRPEYISSVKKMFISTDGLFVHEWNLSQCYNLVCRCDVLIAPDSWSKYVARCHSKKMILLCSDLPHITQEDLYKYCFHDICDYSGTKILKNKTDGSLAENINDIPIPEIINKLNEHLF